MSIFDRVKNGWNAFAGRDPTMRQDLGSVATSLRPDRNRGITFYSDKTFITSVKNRIAMDVAAISINHVKVDENGRYTETVDSPLNDILTLEANKDQTSRAFIQSMVYSMLDEGCVAVVPSYAKVKISSNKVNAFNITAMRVGKIIQWYPNHVLVEFYNEENGQNGQVLFAKRTYVFSRIHCMK